MGPSRAETPKSEARWEKTELPDMRRSAMRVDGWVEVADRRHAERLLWADQAFHVYRKERG